VNYHGSRSVRIICCRRNIGGIRKRAAMSVGNVGGTGPLTNSGGASFIFRPCPARPYRHRATELLSWRSGWIDLRLTRIIDSPARVGRHLCARRSTAWPGGCSTVGGGLARRTAAARVSSHTSSRRYK